ncbi:MAG: uridylate kinase [Lachnospiraceae bacterium]|nr:uridylate kinase [Lachnospiraceae bacterium]
MSKFDIEMVGKVGSMALIRKEDHDLDYNIFSRIGNELRPGMIWISSGAVEIGRLDYMQRNGGQTLMDDGSDDSKTDYSAQGQSILMQNYRNFISPNYSVRQILVEHQHFNDMVKREHIKNMLLRCVKQNAIPIVNYNDAVSCEENRQMELAYIRSNRGGRIVECIDNDETAAVITGLVKARLFVILTSVDGIYKDIHDPSSLITEIGGKDADEVIENIHETQKFCFGASRAGAGGAEAKLGFAIEPVKQGTTVIIANAKCKLSEVIQGTVPRTVIGVR